MTDTIEQAPLDMEALEARWGFKAAPPTQAWRRTDETKVTAPTIKESPGAIALQYMNHTPPPDWVRLLREMNPKVEGRPYLTFAWKDSPQSKRKDMGRWMLYECQPDRELRHDLRAMLLDKPYWDLPTHEQATRASFVSAYQWLMYRKEGVYAQPVWILQGSHGGTPTAYEPLEMRLLALRHLPETPPPRGALPYAPWDQRAVQALQKRDRLRQVGGSLERLRSLGASEAQKAQVELEEREFRRAMVAYWSDQLEGESDQLQWVMNQSKKSRGVFRKQTPEEAAAQRIFEERYIETGAMGLLPGDL